jgi:hypothetical protein
MQKPQKIRLVAMSLYNALINLCSECSERERRLGTNKKKNQWVHDSRCEFGPHRHWRMEL